MDVSAVDIDMVGNISHSFSFEKAVDRSLSITSHGEH